MGVESLEVDGIKMVLGSVPKRAAKQLDIGSDILEANIKVPAFNGVINPNVKEYVEDTIKTDELTEEQLLFYSSRTEEAQG